jgi:hypothetical protein
MINFDGRKEGVVVLQLVLWIGLYTLILLALGSTIRPWCNRTWFKLLCLPGTLLGAGLQGLAALLALGSIKKANFFRDGKPFLEFELSRLPNLGTGVFVASCHGLLFTLFLVSVSQLESSGLLCAMPPSLPEISLSAIAEGNIRTGAYFHGTVGWLVDVFQSPFVASLFLYAAVTTFCSLKLSPREWRASLICLFGLGLITYSGIWLGIGFRLFSRGWWASWYYLPSGRSLFALYVTLALLTLLLTAGLRLLAAFIRRAYWLHQAERTEGRSASAA